jgi:hypothetical protein
MTTDKIIPFPAPVLKESEHSSFPEQVAKRLRTGKSKVRLEELAKLKHAALAELERRGYEVRGKTPAQIREMLKRPPKKLRVN